MKVLHSFMDETRSQSVYESPRMEVIEIGVERGFEVSGDGFTIDGTYDEEDVIW